MNRILLVLIWAICSMKPLVADAKGDEFDDLLALYIDEKYDKLVTKAYSYTQNDKYRRHPLPYVYAAMGYYEMSKDQKYKEDYPRAQQYALKYAIRFRKKDADGNYLEEYRDFFSELRATVIEDAENQLGTAKTMRKAHKIYRYLTQLDPSDGASWLMRGYCEAKMRLGTEAEKSMKVGTPAILNIEKLDDLSEEQQYLLKFGLMTYSDFLIESGMTDSAKHTIDLGNRLFDKDDAYKEKWDEIKGN